VVSLSPWGHLSFFRRWHLFLNFSFCLHSFFSSFSSRNSRDVIFLLCCFDHFLPSLRCLKCKHNLFRNKSIGLHWYTCLCAVLVPCLFLNAIPYTSFRCLYLLVWCNSISPSAFNVNIVQTLHIFLLF